MNDVENIYTRKANVNTIHNAQTLVFSSVFDKIKESIDTMANALKNSLGKEGALCQYCIDEKLNKQPKSVHSLRFKDKAHKK